MCTAQPAAGVRRDFARHAARRRTTVRMHWPDRQMDMPSDPPNRAIGHSLETRPQTPPDPAASMQSKSGTALACSTPSPTL
jgi:hypothetical protein